MSKYASLDNDERSKIFENILKKKFPLVYTAQCFSRHLEQTYFPSTNYRKN